MSPRWNGSSPLMHRKNVDLPAPLGPMMTTTSPRLTAQLMPRRTSNVPKNLWTSCARSTSSGPSITSGVSAFRWRNGRTPDGQPDVVNGELLARSSPGLGARRSAAAEASICPRSRPIVNP